MAIAYAAFDVADVITVSALVAIVVAVCGWLLHWASVRDFQERERDLQTQLEAERKEAWRLRYELTALMRKYIAEK